MEDSDSQILDNNSSTTVESKNESKKRKTHRLKQRFQVVKKLGQGTYGKVQLAINNETGQEVAIKTIKKSKVNSQQDLIRIRREIQIMSSIQHPHIIHIFEVFENKDKIVLVMQYASGGELYDYVSYHKVLSDSEARRLFRQIATAIYYCHKYKICHRDLKLENIILDEKGNAKIADFGLSNVFDEKHFLQTFCGSPLYASPEIVRGLAYYGPEVDCWSLGVLLYTLVYGAMPFDGSNFKKLVKQISESSYFEPPNKSSASDLIKKLLKPNPQERATIIDICNDPWVNCDYEHSLLQFAEDLSNLSPVRLDLILALAPVSPTEQKKIDFQSNENAAPSVPPPTNDNEDTKFVETGNKRPVDSSSAIDVKGSDETEKVSQKRKKDKSQSSVPTESVLSQSQTEMEIEPTAKPPVENVEEKVKNEENNSLNKNEPVVEADKTELEKNEKTKSQNSLSSNESNASISKRPGRLSIPKIWDNTSVSTGAKQSPGANESEKKALFIPVGLKVSEAKKVIERRCSVDLNKDSASRRESLTNATELNKEKKLKEAKKYTTRSFSLNEIDTKPIKRIILKQTEPSETTGKESVQGEQGETVSPLPSKPSTPITDEEKSLAKQIISKNIAKVKLMEKRQTSVNSSESETIPLVSIENSKVSLIENLSNQKVPSLDSSEYASVRSEDSRDNVLSTLPVNAAPITRSYKKVTFTKDGACITESGKVYTHEGKNGVTTRVEKKSKVTHIVSNPGSSINIQRSDSQSSSGSTDIFDDIFDDHWSGDVFTNVKSIFNNFFDRPLSKLNEKRSLRTRAESLERNNWFAKKQIGHQSVFDDDIFDSPKSLFSKSSFSSSFKSCFDRASNLDNFSRTFNREVKRDSTDRANLPRINRILTSDSKVRDSLNKSFFSDYDNNPQETTRKRVEQWLQSEEDFDNQRVDSYGTIGPRGSRRYMQTFTTNDSSDSFFKKFQLSKNNASTNLEEKLVKHSSSVQNEQGDDHCKEEKEIEVKFSSNNGNGNMVVTQATLSTGDKVKTIDNNNQESEDSIKISEQSSLLEQLRTFGYKNLVSRRLSDASSTEDLVQSVNESLSSLNIKPKDDNTDGKKECLSSSYSEAVNEILMKRKQKLNCNNLFDGQTMPVDNGTISDNVEMGNLETVQERIHRKSYYSRFNEDSRSLFSCRQRRRSMTRLNEYNEFFGSNCSNSSSSLANTNTGKALSNSSLLQSYYSFDPDRTSSNKSSLNLSNELLKKFETSKSSQSFPKRSSQLNNNNGGGDNSQKSNYEYILKSTKKGKKSSDF